MNSARGLVVAVAGSALLAAATTSPAMGAENCSLNTIRGTYAWEMKGLTFEGGLSLQPLPVPAPGIPMLEGTVFPIYMTGVMTVGSDGNAKGTYFGLFGLVPLGYSTPVPWTASFTVHSDCTGVMQAPNAFGGINTDVVVILANGREIRTLGLAGVPFAWQFRMVRISHASEGAPMCGPDTGRGRYLMQCEGFEAQSPGPPPVYVGVSPMFLFDVAADGGVSGLLFAPGHPEGVAVTGMVTVSADCTAQTTMQTDALPGMTTRGKVVYYNNGKESFGGPIIVFSGETPVPGAFAGFGCHMTRLAR